MQIPSNRLDRAFLRNQSEYEEKAIGVLRSGNYILGGELAAFENEFAAYCGANHCVGVASGLDALWITLHLLGVGPGDEVIVQGNTFIASVMGITKNGATPVFAEPTDGFFIDADDAERKITPRTKAILVTHLYGMATPMDKIQKLCKKYRLRLVEDCAQAHGAKYRGRSVGTFGDAGCFSFYPTKNLGAFGDGGAVLTQSEALFEQLRIFRNYGKAEKSDTLVVGANSRLDELQAGLLRVRLSHLNELNEERRRIARRYAEGVRHPEILLPAPAEETLPVWHQYVIRCRRRDALKAFLAEKGVGTDIHYPIPPHLSTAYRSLQMGPGSLPVTEKHADTVLSLPMFIGLSEAEQEQIIEALNSFPAK